MQRLLLGSSDTPGGKVASDALVRPPRPKPPSPPTHTHTRTCASPRPDRP